MPYRIREVAERANVPEDFVRRLVALGALPAEEAGLGPREVRRARLLHAWERAGFPVETILALVDRSELSLQLLDTSFLDTPAMATPERLDRSYEQLAADRGAPVPLVQALHQALGFAPQRPAAWPVSDRRARMPGMTTQARGWRSWLLSGDFGRFWLGQTVSNLGSSFTFFALPLLVFKLTGSPINLGITTAAEFVPYLLFGLVIGAWVDRVDRKRLMVATDLGRAAVVAAIPLLAAADALTVGWVYVVAFLSATLSIAFDAAEFAAIPSLVPSGDDLVTANGRVQASYSAAQIAGPLLAGLLVTVAPIQQVLWVDAASFLVSAGTLLLIRTAFNAARPEGEERRAVRREVADGLRYVLGHPVLRNISAMMALINLVVATVGAQLVVFAKLQLDASDSRVALLYAAGSAGVVLLSLAAGPVRRRLSFSVAALGALVVDGLLTMVLAATRWYWAALVLWAAISGLGIFFNINTASLRQQIVPNHLLGRVMSIAGVLAWSAIPVGALAGGWAVEQTGSVALVYGVIGALVALLALGFSLGPLGHADRYLPAQPAPAEAP